LWMTGTAGGIGARGSSHHTPVPEAANVLLQPVADPSPDLERRTEELETEFMEDDIAELTETARKGPERHRSEGEVAPLHMSALSEVEALNAESETIRLPGIILPILTPCSGGFCDGVGCCRPIRHSWGGLMRRLKET
jgi:hypothetical protein